MIGFAGAASDRVDFSIVRFDLLSKMAEDRQHSLTEPTCNGWKLLFILYSTEGNMAKRRNLKKEKAERNQAYARKFRKRPTGGRMFKSRFRPQSGGGTSAEEDNEDTSAAAT
jgi:hypothetical protein